ncbi:hypothetical protein F5Y13DRAFT_82451 [Hypoxylon sp. FL1857]|nr:hypothetical protein F5Y13DRAFT_82451 [Hypoxylon sp. FL1857]
MAGASPTRRSSRARITQSQSNNTSSASSSSGRAERSTRAFTKTGSPQKSTGSGSLSSEPPEDSTTTNDDTILRRRSTRGKDDEREKHTKIELLDMMPVGDENQEDDEAVRCICGHDEYPGPPPFDEDSKHGLKDAIDHERIFAIEVTDDMAGFYVQCEVCNTWQHGACVGFAEESNPEDVQYFCEKCRKDLHKIYTASNGQKYSIFLPIHRPSRAASRATSMVKDGAQSPKGSSTKNSRSSANAHTSKRRSTMNSRDAAYDEEEQLRRAIEASKEDAIPELAEPPPRRPKRGRDDSEEKVEGIKRQRTNSKSPSPKAERPQSPPPEESDDESTLRNGLSKKSRNAARNQREKAERDERREEQERKRAEAANKRKGRAERRRADDSDPSDEVPLSARAAANRTTESAQPPEPPVSSQPAPDTPPAAPVPVSSNKKKATNHKKKGRNQYTKDRDNRDHDESPARSVSRDITRNGDENGTSHTKSSAQEGTGKQSKAKGGMNSRITMTDMKRRANNILEYITRTQVELASEPLSEPADDGQQNSAPNGTANGVPLIKVNGDSHKKPESANTNSNGATTNGTNGANSTLLALKEFKEMSCIEMMDVLTRDLVKWQQEFAP